MQILQFLIISLISFNLVSCGGVNPNTAPETQVLHYGTAIVEGANEVQKFVNSTSNLNPAFVETGRKITNVNAEILKKAELLDTLINVYHNTKKLEDKQKANNALKDINDLVLSLLQLDSNNEYLKLVQNVLSIVFNVQARI